jgi:hypothetical protein
MACMPERLSTLTASKLQELQVTDLMRVISAKAFSPADPGAYFSEQRPRSLHRDLVTKHFETMDYAVPYQHAAVAPGGTGDSAWAQPSMVPALLRGFLPLVKAAGIVGKVPFTPTPFNVKLTKQTA